MPLRDHFRTPLHPARHWETFLAHWCAMIADWLNQLLPPKHYFAEMRARIGGRSELKPDTPETIGWAPSAAGMSMPMYRTDTVEVLVYGTEPSYLLVAAVELVSPGNKDRPEARRGFASKCATYLQQGIGVVVADVVTNENANLHNELVDLLGVGAGFLIPDGPLYAVAYRPIRRPNDERIDVWPAALMIEKPLPTLPLALDKGLCLPLDLESPYVEACQRSRLPV